MSQIPDTGDHSKVDEDTKAFVADQLSRLDARVGQIPQLTAQTGIPVKLTIRNWITLAVTIVMVTSCVVGYVIRDEYKSSQIQQQVLAIRKEFADQALAGRKEFSEQIIAMDSTWQLRLLEALATLKEDNGDTVRAIELEIAKGILPSAQRQIDDIKREIAAIKKLIEME